jgi:hypothetical protein
MRCKSPVLGSMNLFGQLGLTFVPSANFKQAGQLPSPTVHIFAHRSVAPIFDGLKQVRGYWASEMAVGTTVMSGLLKR